MPKAFLENVDIDQFSSIKAAAYVQNLIDVPLHYHPEHEIVFILNGRGKVYLAAAETTFKEGQLFFIGGNVPHLFEDEGLATGKRSLSKVVVIQFTEKFFESLWLLPEFEKIMNVFDVPGDQAEMYRKEEPSIGDLLVKEEEHTGHDRGKGDQRPFHRKCDL